jgi:hypothetical protein
LVDQQLASPIGVGTLVRAGLRSAPAALLSLVVWLIVAFGLLALAGGQT